MALRIPARNVVGDQIMESVTNANTREEQVTRLGGTSPIAAVTGTITTATSTVTHTAVGPAGTCLIMIYGTYAGVNVTIEGLDDAGGNTNWIPLLASRGDSWGRVDSTTGVLASNALLFWRVAAARVNQIRVRATAWTSGTANVIIDPAIPFGEPIVSSIQSNPGAAQLVSYNTTAAGVGQATTTEALNAMTGQRDIAAIGSASTFTVPTGKTFRVLGMSSWARNGAATATMMATNLRAVKTGTVTATTGGILIPLLIPLPATTGSTNRDNYTAASSFIEIPSGWNWGVSSVLGIASAATIVGVSVYGIEY